MEKTNNKNQQTPQKTPACKKASMETVKDFAEIRSHNSTTLLTTKQSWLEEVKLSILEKKTELVVRLVCCRRNHSAFNVIRNYLDDNNPIPRQRR